MKNLFKFFKNIFGQKYIVCTCVCLGKCFSSTTAAAAPKLPQSLSANCRSTQLHLISQDKDENLISQNIDENLISQDENLKSQKMDENLISQNIDENLISQNSRWNFDCFPVKAI